MHLHDNFHMLMAKLSNLKDLLGQLEALDPSPGLHPPY